MSKLIVQQLSTAVRLAESSEEEELLEILPSIIGRLLALQSKLIVREELAKQSNQRPIEARLVPPSGLSEVDTQPTPAVITVPDDEIDQAKKVRKMFEKSTGSPRLRKLMAQTMPAVAQQVRK